MRCYTNQTFYSHRWAFGGIMSALRHMNPNCSILQADVLEPVTEAVYQHIWTAHLASHHTLAGQRQGEHGI